MRQIDERIEPLVRSALDSAVQRNMDGFGEAMSRFANADDSLKALELVLSISAFVLFDVYDGQPSANQVSGLAQRISEKEAWFQVQPAEADGVLRLLTNGNASGSSIDTDRTALVAFVVAAHLLASASRPQDGEWWFNYLDKIEAAIEASS